jgi:succinate-acetate transporter protein
MVSEKSQVWANPAALGLAGFGLTTTVLNLANMGVIGSTGYTIAYGYAYGGLAQVIAGIIEFRRGSLFGGTAFTSYGLFWIGLALLETLGLKTSPGELAAWMFMWGVFTLYLTIAAKILRARATTVVLALLTILFFMLTASFASGSQTLLKITGAEGVATGLSAVYTSAAIVINDAAGKQVLPV